MRQPLLNVIKTIYQRVFNTLPLVWWADTFVNPVQDNEFPDCVYLLKTIGKWICPESWRHIGQCCCEYLHHVLVDERGSSRSHGSRSERSERGERSERSPREGCSERISWGIKRDEPLTPQHRPRGSFLLFFYFSLRSLIVSLLTKLVCFFIDSFTPSHSNWEEDDSGYTSSRHSQWESPSPALSHRESDRSERSHRLSRESEKRDR